MTAKKISAGRQLERREKDENESLFLYHDFFVYTDAIKIETENILRKNGNEVEEAEKKVEKKENRDAAIAEIISILISKGIITQKHARYARDFISERLA